MLLYDIVKDMKGSRYLQTKDAAGLLPDGSGFFTGTVDAESNIIFQGLKIHIENRKGSIRKGEDEDGEKWKTKMYYPYGEILGTQGADGDPIDCFIGPDEKAEQVFIIRSKIDGKYDEDKCMLGFADELHARDAFLAHYQDDSHLGPISKMGIVDFIIAIKDHKKGTRIGDADTNNKIFGYEWEKIKAVQQKQGSLVEHIDLNKKGDYGADPLGNGKFKMIPSGDIVDFEERNRRLKK
jgi:inorganic pyrophosphatase